MLDIKPVSDEKSGISDEETSGTGLQSGGICQRAMWAVRWHWLLPNGLMN